MSIRRRSRNERGPGAHRFDDLLQQRAPKRLEHDEFILFEHALRCFCSLCGSLLNWDCPEDISYTETECCGLRYRLQPWTVKVVIEDVSARPILPEMAGSSYSDPEYELRDGLVGEADVESSRARPLSVAQQSLSFGDPTLSAQQSAQAVRRCGICAQPGHTRRTCPRD